MIVYGIGDGTLETVYASPMYQGSSALAFLTGNFIGSGYTQIAQTRDNNGTLQLLVYGYIGNGNLSTVFSNDVSQTPYALAWVTGDFTGTGNTQILQPWMTVLSWPGSDGGRDQDRFVVPVGSGAGYTVRPRTRPGSNRPGRLPGRQPSSRPAPPIPGRDRAAVPVPDGLLAPGRRPAGNPAEGFVYAPGTPVAIW